MKKNQERRLHRKNAKIVKEGGVPMTLDRPMKPDTTRRCGHCGQMGHMSESDISPFFVFLEPERNRNQPEMSSLGRIQQWRCAGSLYIFCYEPPSSHGQRCQHRIQPWTFCRTFRSFSFGCEHDSRRSASQA